MRDVAEGFKHKAVVLLIFRLPQHIMSKVIALDFRLSLGKHQQLIHIQSQLLLLPPLYIKGTRVADGVYHPRIGRFGRVKVFIDPLPDVASYQTVVLYFLLSTQCSQNVSELLGQFCLPVLFGILVLVVDVEVQPNRVL